MLLFAEYFKTIFESYPHLSIHEIRSDNRVGPVLWSFYGSIDEYFNILGWELIKSTENLLGITVGRRFKDHWKLFDISTDDTDSSDNFPLIESGRIDFDLKLHSGWVRKSSPGLSKFFHAAVLTCPNVFSQSYYPLTGAFS